MNFKTIIVLLLLIAVGEFVAEKWVLKDPADPTDTGFVVKGPGFGLHTFAQAGTVALVVYFGKKFLGKKAGAA